MVRGTTWRAGGTILASPNLQYQLIFQMDGNLVLYNTASGSAKQISNGPIGGSYRNWKLIFQMDGNFVMYNGGPVWNSVTQGKGDNLLLHDNGVVFVENASG